MVGKGFAWLLALAVVAGCAGKEPEATEQSAPAALGVLDGVVVDEAIRPIAGVNLTLDGSSLNATSDSGGAFRFAGLGLGVYVLRAEHPGYLAHVVTVTVAAETSKVNVMLVRDPLPQPYHVSLSFDFYTDLGVMSMEAYVDDFVRGLLGDGAPTLCTRCFVTFSGDRPVQEFILEAYWQETIDNPTGEVFHEWTLDAMDGTHRTGETAYGALYNGVPVSVPDNPLNDTVDFGLTLFFDHNWVHFQQEVNVFVTLWYLEAAPAGWSIADDPLALLT